MSTANVANREEAENCASIAREALKKGDVPRAQKFLDKSMRLYPNKLAADLIAELKNHGAGDNSHSQSHTHTHAHTNTNNTSSNRRERAKSRSPPRQRSPRRASPPKGRPSSSSSAPSSASAASAGGDYTADQRTSAQSICKSKSHYDTLGIPRNASQQDIKSAYRKLALKFHPDKNKAPEAEEAFKMVSAAFQTLSDATRKRHYDEYGEEESATNSRQAAYHAQQHRTREEDISPDEIFRMFFGANGIPNHRFEGRRVYRQHRRQEENSEGGQQGPVSSFSQLLHFLPLLLLLLFSFASMPSAADDTPFAFAASSSTPIRRETSKHGTEYFVSSSFAGRYTRNPSAMSHVESLVEQGAYRRYEEECKTAKQEQKQSYAAAKKEKNPVKAAEKMEKARNFNLDACNKMRQQAENL